MHARSVIKDLIYSDKEIQSQKDRIEKTKGDDGKDDHDVRKQEEVLAEYESGKADEADRLLQRYEELAMYLVRACEMRAPRAACMDLFLGRVCARCC